MPNRPIGCLAIKSFFAFTGSLLFLTLSSHDGVNTVPGAIALHLILFLTKSEAIDLVSPIIAAFVAPYTNLFGKPLMLETTDEILIIPVSYTHLRAHET